MITKVFKKATFLMNPDIFGSAFDKLLEFTVSHNGHTYGLRIVQLDGELPENPFPKGRNKYCGNALLGYNRARQAMTDYKKVIGEEK